MADRKHRVVIVGGGFGGLAAAKALAGADAEIVLIDRRNHHLFQPLLYQVAIVDVQVHREQLHGGDAQPGEMLEEGRLHQAQVGAPEFLRHLRVTRG